MSFKIINGVKIIKGEIEKIIFISIPRGPINQTYGENQIKTWVTLFYYFQKRTYSNDCKKETTKF